MKCYPLWNKKFYPLDENNKRIPEVFSSFNCENLPHWTGITPDGREIHIHQLVVALDDDMITDMDFDSDNVAHFNPCT